MRGSAGGAQWSDALASGECWAAVSALVFDDRPGKRKDSPGIELFPECLQIDCSILHADKVIFIGCYMLLETNELMNYWKGEKDLLNGFGHRRDERETFVRWVRCVRMFTVRWEWCTVRWYDVTYTCGLSAWAWFDHSTVNIPTLIGTRKTSTVAPN